MKHLKKILIATLVLTSSIILAGEKTIPVLTIELGQANKIKSISGFDKSLEQLSSQTKKKRVKFKSKKRFEKRLNKAIKKLSKIVSKAMKADTAISGRYELSEVEVSLSLSSELGISDVFSVGGAGGIVLHFIKE